MKLLLIITAQNDDTHTHTGTDFTHAETKRVVKEQADSTLLEVSRTRGNVIAHTEISGEQANCACICMSEWESECVANANTMRNRKWVYTTWTKVINLRSIWLTTALCPKGWSREVRPKENEGKDGRQHIISSNRSQAREQIAGNDENYQIKKNNISETLCFFCEYRIKCSQRERFSTVIRKKNSKCKRTDYQYIYRNDYCRSTVRDTTKRLSIWDFDFILILSERLCCCNYGLSQNSKCCSFNHRGDQEGNRGLNVSFLETIWISGCFKKRKPRQDMCSLHWNWAWVWANQYWLIWMASLGVTEHPGVWLSDYLPGVSVLACLALCVCCVRQWVCLWVAACRSSFAVV